MADETLERSVIQLVAADRIDIPISSISGKLKRMKPKLALAVDIGDESKPYKGERVYARVEKENEMKARGMRDGIEEFSRRYPQYGKILEGIIAEQREWRETHLYFGMRDGCRLTADDYLGVMTDLGFTPARSEGLYAELMEVSRNLSRKRDEERSVMLGTTLG